MYRHWLGMMDSEYFNICCDESPHLGEDPKNMALARRIGKDGIFARYVNELHSFLKKHGKKTMIWGDMLLHYPRLTKLLPRDMIILDWDYGDFRRGDRQSTERFKEMGYPVVICPAAYRSGELCSPANFQYQWNVAAYITRKYHLGLEGVLTCLWETFTTFIDGCWPGLLSAAEYSWSVNQVPIPAFKQKFARFFFGENGGPVMDVYRLLDGNIFHERKKPLEPDYHEGVEFTNSHPFAFLKYEEHDWPRMLEKRSEQALKMLQKIRPKIKKHADKLDYIELGARGWRQLAWKRLIPNRVGLLLKKAELFKVKNPRLSEQCVKDAITLLKRYLKDAREVRSMTAKIWNRSRYPKDFNLRAYFTNFYDWNIQSLQRKVGELKNILRKFRNDRDLSLVSPLSGLPVLYIHTKNHSDIHVNIVRPIITYSSDGSRWSLLNNKGLLLWKSKYYRNLIMLPDEKLPRYIRIVIERTHVDWDFNKYPDDITITVMETLSPFDDQPVADFESVDYRVKKSRSLRYDVVVRKKKELMLRLVKKASP
jgi:hypothetical protein